LLVGEADGCGDGFGESVCEAVGSVGAGVGVSVLTVGETVGFVVGEGVVTDGDSLGLGEGAGVGKTICLCSRGMVLVVLPSPLLLPAPPFFVAVKLPDWEITSSLNKLSNSREDLASLPINSARLRLA